MNFDPYPYRALFPVTKTWNYLNHATHGPIPVTTSQAIAGRARDWHSPADIPDESSDATTQSVRRLIGTMINAPDTNIAFTGNLAESMSLAASGIEWQPGDNCVIPVGEFPSVVYPFLNLSHRGVEVRFAEKGRDGYTSLDAVRDRMDRRTRAVVLSHVEFQTGFRNDIAGLTELCAEFDALSIVDATQSLGPCGIDVAATGVDFVGAHSYKWLLASYGVGVTYLSDRAIERIRPTYAGRLSVQGGFEDLTYTFNFRDGAERYQTGGLNWITLTGLEASLELLFHVGLSNIQKHVIALTERLLDHLERQGRTILSSRTPSHRSSVIVFSVGDDATNSYLVQELASRSISVVKRGSGVRVSPYFYNTFDEIDALAAAIDEIVE